LRAQVQYGRDRSSAGKTLGLTFIAAFPALLTPAIIIGGMTFGWSRRRSRDRGLRLGDDLGIFSLSHAVAEAVLQGHDGYHRDEPRACC